AAMTPTAATPASTTAVRLRDEDAARRRGTVDVLEKSPNIAAVFAGGASSADFIVALLRAGSSDGSAEGSTPGAAARRAGSEAGPDRGLNVNASDCGKDTTPSSDGAASAMECDSTTAGAAPAGFSRSVASGRDSSFMRALPSTVV